MMLAEATFWLSLAVIAWVWMLYPVGLAAWRRLRRRPVRRRPWKPAVDVIIAAHNEAGRIDAKVRNCLSLDYPPDKLRVIVSLDGPTDGTDAVVACWSMHPRVTICGCEQRRGKAAALNAAMAHLVGEVVLFADARQRIGRDAVRHLVADLSDPAVGVVSGELVLLDDAASDGGSRTPGLGEVGSGANGGANGGAEESETGGAEMQGTEARGGQANGGDAKGVVGIYWRYEKLLRRMESDIHSMLGATGAIYAIRRELLAPIPDSTILDDVLIPMRAVLAGRRAVFQPAARAWDHVCPPAREYRRKVRTLMGNFQVMALEPALLSPSRNPVFLQFVTHKLGRLLVPYFLVALYGASLALYLRDGGVYSLFFWAQTAFYGLALLGAGLESARSDHDRDQEHPVPHASAAAWPADPPLAWQSLPGGRQELPASTRRDERV